MNHVSSGKRAAFTLVELLTVITIIAILAALSTIVAGKVQEQGYLAREVSAGRSLVAGYLAAAADRNGELMPGYSTTAEDVVDDIGQPIHYPASGRYPWRLAKYLGGPVRGSLIVNQQAKLVEKRNQHDFYTYLVSLMPTFGINATYVGGDQTSSIAPTTLALGRYGQFCLTNVVQASSPSRQIVFCSAHFQSEPGDGQYGYNLVKPPSTTRRNWSGSYKKDAPPENFGFVHFRYNDKAVAAMLDGHVEMLDFEQAQDMRRWCNIAAENNDENYKLTPIQ